MEMDARKRTSRRQKRTGQVRADSDIPHFRTVRYGGFDEARIICYLWDLVKAVEAIELVETIDGTGEDSRQKIDAEKMEKLKKQIRSRVRVEMRRYFLRQKRRNVKRICSVVLMVLGVAVLFVFLIGIDRVSGNSMYPYLNHGDWIVYSRVSRELRRGEVVVFEKNGEVMVKRITGLPGDQVEISASGYHVVVNGIPIQETCVPLTNPVLESGGDRKIDRMGVPMTVMDGQYLVLGDNREISIDSRDSDIGTVSEGNILGRVVLIVRMNG